MATITDLNKGSSFYLVTRPGTCWRGIPNPPTTFVAGFCEGEEMERAIRLGHETHYAFKVGAMITMERNAG